MTDDNFLWTELKFQTHKVREVLSSLSVLWLLYGLQVIFRVWNPDMISVLS